jgi:twinkle protein
VSGLLEGTYEPLPKRKITEETCRKFGYRRGEMGGQPVQIADYHDEAGNVVAQKVRFANKDFKFIGDPKSATLFGQRLWGAGKMIVVTEGEIDALSVSQAQNNKWPVVSIPNGAQGAAKSIKKNLTFFDQFETVVLMFDNDEPGREAAQECAGIFPVGKCKVAYLPLKDASEMLQAGKGPEIVNAIWQAKPWRPEGSVKLSDLRDRMKADLQVGLPWCFEPLTKLTYGRRYGEIYTLGAGTGVGKTDFLTQQVEFDLMTLKEKVSVIFLEQQPEETGLRIAGKHVGKRLHVPDAGWTPAERDAAVDALCDNDLLDLYDHFGCAEWDRIEAHIRYLNKAEGYRIFYIDHLTALADTGDSERGSLEEIMGSMGRLVKELDCMIILVSHLTTPEGKPHEEGGRVTIRQFKGSRAIGFWSHYMFGLERDQQAEDETERQQTTFRILKDRYTGQATGQTFLLGYDADTGRLREATPFDTAENPF